MRLFGGLGRRFGWLWAAYSISAYGTWLGFGAFSFIAIRVLHADAAESPSVRQSPFRVVGCLEGPVIGQPACHQVMEWLVQSGAVGPHP